jgi:hypothetical protein
MQRVDKNDFSACMSRIEEDIDSVCLASSSQQWAACAGRSFVAYEPTMKTGLVFRSQASVRKRRWLAQGRALCSKRATWQIA